MKTLKTATHCSRNEGRGYPLLVFFFVNCLGQRDPSSDRSHEGYIHWEGIKVVTCNKKVLMTIDLVINFTK